MKPLVIKITSYILTVFKVDDTTIPHKRQNSTRQKILYPTAGGLAPELEDAGDGLWL